MTRQLQRHCWKRTCNNSLENIKNWKFLEEYSPAQLFGFHQSSETSCEMLSKQSVRTETSASPDPQPRLCRGAWGNLQDAALLRPDSGPESLSYLHSHHLIGQKISFSANSANSSCAEHSPEFPESWFLSSLFIHRH